MTRVIDALVALWVAVSIGLLIACCFSPADFGGPVVAWVIGIPCVLVIGVMLRATIELMLPD